MNKSINTNAIILKRINFKDTDRVLTLYTKDLGKVTAIAKGVRKMNSKRKSDFELMNLIKIQLIEGHQWYIAAQTETMKTFQEIKSNYDLTQKAYYILEIFEKLLPETEENDLLFKFLQKTFEVFNSSRNSNIPNAFNLKLLKLLGYYSNLEHKRLNNDLRKYILSLERLTYEEILALEINLDTTKTIHNYLRSLTEEILEKEIKSKIYWE